MDARRLLKVGLIGAVVAAVCCFTPLLALVFGAVGLNAAVGYLDLALLPALAIFTLAILVALYRLRAR